MTRSGVWGQPCDFGLATALPLFRKGHYKTRGPQGPLRHFGDRQAATLPFAAVRPTKVHLPPPPVFRPRDALALNWIPEPFHREFDICRLQIVGTLSRDSARPA